MTALASSTEAFEAVGLAVDVSGHGRPLLFLHGDDGLLFSRPFIDALARQFTVFAPSHPGWGASPRTQLHQRLDDIAYLYLDVLGAFDEPVHVVGCSIGAWLAMEVATKCDHGIASLTLVSPVGIRTGAPTRRYYLDRYATPAEQLARALYGESGPRPDLTACSDDDLLLLARAQEASALYGWEPYLHNPSLLQRLHRIRRPILLVAGEHDGMILVPNHLGTISSALGGPTTTVVLAGTAHRVEEQAPDELAATVTSFASAFAPARLSPRRQPCSVRGPSPRCRIRTFRRRVPTSRCG